MVRKSNTLLLNLPINLNDVGDYDSVLQPAGLSMISNFLKRQGCDVTLYDAFAHHVTRERILRDIREIDPDILGVTLMTNHLPQTIPFLADVKKMLPHTRTVVGGPHPSSVAESLMRDHPEVDVAVIGEGEFTLHELTQNVEQGKLLSEIQGIAYRENGHVMVTDPRDYVEDLDSLPFSDWGSLPMKNYWEIWSIRKNYANMVLSRGCPFGCTFCGAKKALGRKQRKRSPQHILEEIILLYDRHHVRNILFSDSTLNIDHQWVKEICDGMLELDRPILWGCNLRADRIDKETLKLMKRSGCVKVFVGVESADNEMLKRIKKGEQIEKIEEGIRRIQEIGIQPDLGFILGMPGETESSMKKSIAFAQKYKKSVSAFTLASPFPGTELFEVAKEEGFMVKDWSKFDIYSIAYVPRGLTKELLERYYREAVRGTYLRFSFLLGQLLQLRSWVSFKIKLRFAFRIFFGRLLKLKRQTQVRHQPDHP